MGLALKMDSNLSIWPEELPTPLLTRSHSIAPRSQQTVMESARLRIRRQTTEILELISVNWNFTVDQFSVFQAFHSATLLNGELPFQLDTLDVSPNEGMLIATSREVAFWEGKYSFTKTDNCYTVTAQLEVVFEEGVEINDPSYVAPVLPELPIDFPSDTGSCREEFRVTMTSLDLQTIYALEIAESEDGDFDTHIYFALLTEEEQSSKTKVLRINNDYDGGAWFRAVRLFNIALGPHHKVLTEANKPLAAEVRAPDLTVLNLTELNDDAGIGVMEDGLRPLNAYRHGSAGWVIPLSGIEDPIIYSTLTYARFRRKYATRFNKYTGYYGNLDLSISGTNNQVTYNDELGSVTKFTIDGTDPTIDSIVPPYDGIERNAATYRPSFSGIIKARSFKGSCRSPLTMVCIDKLVPSGPIVTTTLHGDLVTANCDLEDPSGGSPSSISCVALYGSEDNADIFVKDASRLGSSISDDGSSMPLVELRSFHTVDYKGSSFYTNHYISASSASLMNCEFRRLSGAGLSFWNAVGLCHTWGICKVTDTDNYGRAALQPGATLAGPSPEEASIATDLFNTALYARIGRLIDGRPDSVLDPILGIISMQTFLTNREGSGTPERFLESMDVVIAQLAWENMRELTWSSIQANLSFVPPILPPPPTPIIVPTFYNYPGDSFELYSDGGAGSGLDAGTDWDNEWVFFSPTATEGGETFESYSNATISDGDAAYTGGDSWEENWLFRTGVYNAVYTETFESYSDGDVITFSLDGGLGWDPDLVGAWYFSNVFVYGNETWDAYSNGATSGAETGVNFYPEAWNIE